MGSGSPDSLGFWPNPKDAKQGMGLFLPMQLVTNLVLEVGAGLITRLCLGWTQAGCMELTPCRTGQV